MAMVVIVVAARPMNVDGNRGTAAGRACRSLVSRHGRTLLEFVAATDRKSVPAAGLRAYRRGPLAAPLSMVAPDAPPAMPLTWPLWIFWACKLPLVSSTCSSIDSDKS